MNADQLFALYEKVAEAPDAITRLRRFVLDLAVRGKLVAQDAGDEPASELLRRIAAEKARLVKAGEIKRPKPLDSVAVGEMAFPLPPGWTWTRLSDVAVCLDYMRKPINGTERDRRIEGKSEEELFPYYGATQQQGCIDDYIFDEDLVLLGEDGVPFFDPYRSKAYIISGKTWVNNHAHVFKGILISHTFLAHYLNVFDYTGRVVGATRSKLNQARAVNIPFSLPPLAEQRRIVAKVEELMALLDRLEAARTAREVTRDRLTAASLARLTATDAKPTDFPDNARFALATLPALTTRPDQIESLRQTILNLAVRGKLLEQDPTDQPASELLKRIATEKKRQGVKHSVVPLGVKELPFELPSGWSWTRVGEICSKTGSGSTPRGGKDVYKKSGIPFLRSQNIYNDGLRLDDVAFIDAPTHERMRGTRVLPGDLLLNITGGSMGRCGRVLDNFGDANISQHVAIIRPAVSGMAGFLHSLVLSPYFQAFIFDEQTGAGRGGLPKNRMDKIAVALPPLAEQHRIVAKVDSLMALCDRLAAALATADTTRARLLEALLHETLTPTAAAVTEAAE